MKKKTLVTFDDILDKSPKIKKKFEKFQKKYQNRPKPSKKLKIGLKYIKKHFNLDLFIKKIEKYNYRYFDEGDMLDRVIQYGFKQDESWKIQDHFNETKSNFSKKIIENFDKEILNFTQVCPKEMIDKLENPISIKPIIKEVS